MSRTTYSYDPATAEQTNIAYNDGTLGLAYTFNRLGQNTQVTQIGPDGLTASFDHFLCSKISTAYLDASFYGGRVLAYKLNQTADGTKGRTLGNTLSAGATVEQDTTYGYDSGDRFRSLAVLNSGQTVSTVFRYTYRPDANLLSTLTVDGSPFVIARSYETQRDVLTGLATQWGAAVRTGFDYVTNALGQRVSGKQTGDAFADYYAGADQSTFQAFAYDSRGQLTSAIGYLGAAATSGKEFKGRNFTYSFDHIGNRQAVNHTTVPGLAEHYAANALNQYTSNENWSASVAGTADTDVQIAVAGGNGAAPRKVASGATRSWWAMVGRLGADQ